MRAVSRVRNALALLGVASLGVAMLGGCVRIPLPVAGGTFGTGPRQGSKAAPSTPTTPTPAMVGAPQSAGSWQITVVRARSAARGPGGAKPAKGKAFLLIDVQFRNVRMSETLIVYPKDASLTNASGKKIAAVGSAPGYNGRGMREITPGYGGFTTFVYQIPHRSHSYTFTFAPRVGSHRAKMQWQVL